MEYVHVVSNATPLSGKADYTKATTALVDICLYSLIGGLKQKRFGLDTLIGAAHDINEFNRRYLALHRKKILVDSGGYSIIAGDVSDRYIGKFIGCYHEYQVKCRTDYDFIMSLDIPLILGDDRFNTKKNIYYFNKLSLEATKENLMNHPELQEKLYFVWQFKTKEHYEIWDRIVSELNLNRYIQRRAIGGMVSLRSIAAIDFSPFIANTFKCLFDYEVSQNVSKEFRLHLLGINIRYDRFTIAYLEKLFTRYLGTGSNAAFSYDSISYSRTAQLAMKSLEIYDFDGEEINPHIGIATVPQDILKRAYPNELLDDVSEEIANMKSLKRLNNSSAFAPLNIYSNRSIDRYFEYVVDRYELIEIIFNSKNGITFNNHMRKVFIDLNKKHPYLFTENMIRSIKKNLSYILDFHRWYMNGKDPQILERKIYGFIDQIGFPTLLI